MTNCSTRSPVAAIRRSCAFTSSIRARKRRFPTTSRPWPDYKETRGKSEGKTTTFCDWSHAELKRFTLDFYTKFAQRYDKDPRLAYLETGFGLWAEYHIYDGPMKLGKTFPDKKFQAQFVRQLNMSGTFSPVNPLAVSSAGTSTTGSTTAATIPISALGHLSSADWSTTLPSGLLEAVMSDTQTKILQAPQLRAVDNVKASMKIGDREPFASGSFGSALGLSGAGVSPLVNTQFQYQDIGVNVDITPRVHDNGDVSLHVEMEISSIDGQVNLGGVNEPIVAQKKVVNDMRLHEGEVNLLGGLIDEETDTSKTGVPGLVDIPLLGRLFRSDSVTKTRSELMIAIVPHVLRRPSFTEENLRAIDVGSANTIHVNYAAGAEDGAPPPSGVAAPQAGVALSPGPASAAAPAAPVPALSPVPQQPVLAPGPTSSPLPPRTGFPVSPGPPGAPGAIPFPLQQLIRPQGGTPVGIPGGQPGAAPGAIPVQPGTSPATLPPQPPGGSAANAAASAPAGATTDAAQRPPNVAARFEPANFQTAVNSMFSASLVIDSGSDIASAQPLQIKYDPNLLKLVDVSPGDLFSKDGAVPLFTKDVHNDQGVATIQTSRQAGAAGVNGPGTLLTLRFQALAAGANTVSVLNVTLRDSKGRSAGSSQPQLSVVINNN